jgi:hypothetical protein
MTGRGNITAPATCLAQFTSRDICFTSSHRRCSATTSSIGQRPHADRRGIGLPGTGARCHALGVFGGSQRDAHSQSPLGVIVQYRQAHLVLAVVPWGTGWGYQLIHWAKAGMRYWGVSDLNARELQAFVRAVQRQAPLTPSPAR